MECLLSLGLSEECLEMIRAELARAPPTPRLHLMHAKLNLLFEKVKKYHTKYSSNFLILTHLTEQGGLSEPHASSGA